MTVPTALRAEALKAAALPALRWTGVLTAAACALMLAVLREGLQQGAPPGVQATGAAEVSAAVWMWAGLVQLGFLAAGILLSTKEHTSPLGRTTLLVTPGRGAVWAARLVVVLGAALPTAVLAAAAVPVVLVEEPTRAVVEAAARAGAWLLAAAVIAAGAGAVLRQVLGTTSVLLVLVVIAPAVGERLGRWGTWLPGVAAQDWVREASWRGGAVVAAWAVAAAVAGGLRLVRCDA